MSRTANFKQKTNCFIETGTLNGLGVQLALDSGFQWAITIELGDTLHAGARSKFTGNDRVITLQGDSSKVLPEVLETFKGTPFTYWLDGHYSGGVTALGEKESPLMEELEAILSRGVDGELIYIDDMRIYRDFNDKINTIAIKELIKEYKPDATFWFEASGYDDEDILVIDY